MEANLLMNNSVAIILMLVVLIAFTSVNTIRMWQGKRGYFFRRSPPANYEKFRSQRNMTINSMGSFVWWSFALIGVGRLGLRNISSVPVRAVLYVPLVVGWVLLVSALIAGLSIFLTGRPVKFVPPQFRDAAVKKWDDGSKPL